MDARRALRVLGVPPGASPDDVRRAWLDLAQVWHPDRFGDNARLREKAQGNLQRINEAYDALKGGAPGPPTSLRMRITESFSGILGLGELGDAPLPPGGVPAAQAAPFGPTGPIGIRRGIRVLGVGIRASGTFVRRRSRRSLLFAGGLLLVLTAIALVALRRL